MKQNSIFNLWPTFVGEFHNPDHDKIKNGLIEFFKEYKKNDKGGERSNRGENYKLYESSHNLHSSENVYFKSLIQFIAQAVLKISNHANHSRIEQFKIKNEEQDIICKSAWFIDYELESGFVLPHTHMDCSWSCVYYVQIGQNADNKNGSTYFFDPARNRESQDFGSSYRDFYRQNFEPEEGKVLIWPNNILHGSMPYQGEENRIIVSANWEVRVKRNLYK